VLSVFGHIDRTCLPPEWRAGGLVAHFVTSVTDQSWRRDVGLSGQQSTKSFRCH
ncbi:CLIP-associating protein 2 isoform X12, partial [Biomphalaria glabrata]